MTTIARRLFQAAFGLWIPLFAQAAVFEVTNTSDLPDATAGDGNCAALVPGGSGPACTLRAAIMEANALFTNGDSGPFEIRLPVGDYWLTLAGSDEDTAATGDLDIRASNLTLHGWNLAPGSSARIAAGPGFGDRLIDIGNNNTVLLAGLILANANAAQNGAGLFCLDSTLALDRLRIEGSQSQNDRAGGGLFLSACQTDISNSELAGNSALASDGGAIFAQAGTLLIRQSALIGNQADGGAALALRDGVTVRVENSTLSGNSAANHEIVSLQSGSELLLRGVTLIDNTLGSSASAAIYLSESTLQLSHSIIANNARSGAATTVWPALTRAGAAAAFTSYGHNIVSGLADPGSGNGLGELDPTDRIEPFRPGLGALTTLGPGIVPRGYRPLAGGMAERMGYPGLADAANPARCLPVDQTGAMRKAPIDGPCEIGAVEYRPAHVFTVSRAQDSLDAVPGDGLCEVTPNGSGTACSLRAAVMEINALFAAGATGPFEIRLLTGDYRLQRDPLAGDSSIAVDGDLDLRAGEVAIRGWGLAAGETVTVHAASNYTDRLFHVGEGTQARFIDLQLAGANVSPSGEKGGAIDCDSSAVALIRTRILNNQLDGYGSGLAGTFCDLLVQDSEFAGNSGHHAAGIFADGGSLMVERSAFIDNQSNDSPVLIGSGTAITLANVTVSGNQASSSGIVTLYGDGALTLRNVTFTGNLFDNAQLAGQGVVWASGGNIKIANSFVANATLTGGGQPPAFRLSGNAALTSLGYNLMGAIDLEAGSDTLSTPHATDRAVPAEPVLGPLVSLGPAALARGHIPLPGAIAYDAGHPQASGDAASCLPMDQARTRRPRNARCDIGAVEGMESPLLFASGFE